MIIDPIIMIFIYGLAYYVFYRALRAENIVEGILSGFLSTVIALVGIINTYNVGIIENGTEILCYPDTAPYILYPIVILGIIISLLNVLQYISEEKGV
jgi:hypothetical protein